MLLPLALAIFMNETIGQGGKHNSGQPVRIIFDTDFGPDYDDVGALAMLQAMADSDECTILATIASNQHPYVATAIGVLNTYFRRPDIPIGVVRGKAVSIGASQRWDSVLSARYPHAVRNNDAAWDALRLYRRILALQPDTSVTIVTVGFLTNMANLLQSGPDKYSSLTGLELVRKKVRKLVSMAGRFDKEGNSFMEFNVKMDAASSKYAFDHWPTPILFSGFEIGVKIFTGLAITGNAAIRHSPVKDVFERCIPMDPHDKAGRMSWDETAVLVAVRGPERYFDVVKGRVICSADGRTGWEDTNTEMGSRAGVGQDMYLVEKMPPMVLAGVIEGLMMHQPL